jgi:hypothetical protein
VPGTSSLLPSPEPLPTPSSHHTDRQDVLNTFLHNDTGLGDAARDRFVGQDRGAVDVQLVFDGDIIAEDGDVLDTGLAGQYCHQYVTVISTAPLVTSTRGST